MNKAAGLPQIRAEVKYVKASVQDDLHDNFQAPMKPKPKKGKKKKSNVKSEK